MSINRKTIVTLVGLKQAKRGFTFLNGEPLKECEECALFNICLAKLETGRIYEVVEVRNKVFPCKVHEEGVRVVGVIEKEAEANIDNRLAFPSGTITFQPQICGEIFCSNYAKCIPQGLKSGDKCKIVVVKGKAACPLKRQLVSALLQRSVDSAS